MAVPAERILNVMRLPLKCYRSVQAQAASMTTGAKTCELFELQCDGLKLAQQLALVEANVQEPSAGWRRRAHAQLLGQPVKQALTRCWRIWRANRGWTACGNTLTVLLQCVDNLDFPIVLNVNSVESWHA
jgi:hypothetical protein